MEPNTGMIAVNIGLPGLFLLFTTLVTWGAIIWGGIAIWRWKRNFKESTATPKPQEDAP